MIFYKNQKIGSNKFEKVFTKKHDGPVWRLSWSFGGNMLAVSFENGEGNNVVDVYQV